MKYLKIHTLNKGQWYDRDTILLHASFQVLADFIEQEKPDEIVDWQHDELHSSAWSELTQLYRWWKEERPNRQDPLDDVPSPPEEEYVFTEEGQLIFPDREKYPEYYAAAVTVRNSGRLTASAYRFARSRAWTLNRALLTSTAAMVSGVSAETRWTKKSSDSSWLSR